jgi:3,4-dihydroxy 2-butanone 4-phosphate synthase / GTP cyclohydrolase II
MDARLAEALAAWRQGAPIVATVEDGGRRRGDLMLAAVHADASSINEMLLRARGVLSLAIGEEVYARLGLRAERRRLTPNPGAPRAMTTIEATAGVTTGISATDRARTVAAAIDPAAAPGDVRQPGHVPVLLAAAAGVRARVSPVEAAVDLSRLAGLTPAGVLCEALDGDGELAGTAELRRLAGLLGAPLLPIEKLAAHLHEARR